MTIRQMKSMTGLRRFVSDYGFEGVFSRKNYLTFVNRLFIITGGVTVGLSGLIFTMRKHRTEMTSTPRDSMGLVAAEHRNPELDKSIFQRISGFLSDANIFEEDLRIAVSHLAPIESNLIDALEVIDRLNECGDHVNSVQAQAVVQSMNVGHAVKGIVSTLQDDALGSLGDYADAILRGLVQDWVHRGYFNRKSYPNRDVFGHRQTSEAVGVDIGCPIAGGFLGSTRGQRISSSDSKICIRQLQHWGFGVIKNAIPQDTLESLRGSLGITTGHASSVGETVLRLDPNISHSRASPNRLQLILRGSSHEHLLTDVASVFLPVVTSVYDRRYPAAPRVMLSDARVVVVDHAADTTNWTVYNPKGGVSVMIPLQDRDSRSGSQVFIPGSHFIIDSLLPLYQRLKLSVDRYWSLLKPLEVTELFSDGVWRAGDAFIFDNRLLIKGQENRTFKSGSYILLKFETAEEAPMSLYLKGKLHFRFADALDRIAKLT